MTGSALVLVAGCVGATVGAAPASAASCTGATIAQGQGLKLEVSDVLVPSGSCVQYANLTDVTVTVKISGSSFSERIPAKTPASASAPYTATRSATATASDGVRTGQGTISVEPASPAPTPTHVPTPVESVAPPPPSHSPTPAQTPIPTATPSTASPTPSPTATASASAAVIPVLPSLPSGGSSAPPEASHPVVAPQLAGSGTRQVATVLENSGGTRRGLPAAVAAVVVIGLASAYGRAVLAAAPAVDRRRRHVRAPL